MSPLDLLRSNLVVSCQPVDDGPMARPAIVAAMVLAAQAGGAAGLRIEGIANLIAARAVTKLPIIAIVKRDLDDSAVRITPLLEDVLALAKNGADVIAYDATDRQRPVATALLVNEIKSAGCLAMADCSNLAEGEKALAEGADILGTTLSGYVEAAAQQPTKDVGQTDPDFDLMSQFKSLGAFVMAEGRVNSPALAARAMAAGADCVTVGSAITRIEHITGWFVDAVGKNGHA